jgi:hypothetical protein
VSPESDLRRHPVYRLAIRDAIDVANAISLATLSIDRVEAPMVHAGVAGVEKGLRKMLRDYEVRQNEGRTA